MPEVNETYGKIMEELLRSALGSVFPGVVPAGTEKLFGGKDIMPQWLAGVSDYKNMLKETANSGSKALKDQQAQGLKQIERSGGEALENLRDTMVAAGLNRSGVSANAQNKLFEKETDAKNDLVTRIAALNEENRKDALGKLLGIEQTAASLGISDREAGNRLLSMIGDLKLSGERNRMLRDELDLKKRQYEEGKTGFGGVIGSILGSLLGVASGGLALGAGDKLSDMIFGGNS
ncbi:MAG: hypothetical protein LC102_07035 [Ignavibacteriales bacterium]|nr:MAG: hypothetical protein F9K26_10820 [Ignavibacteriaceae bacterium]MBW7874064.1 hypothetical protein [Ignavibacteria bacterium]MCZ2143164.1 hypothetical protein [Ignavibacteriales bacterium]MBV6444044.1 hypothetical protein [Ignavibacteriaceae bacterium]MBZ0196105.1 hypothetical protein [Ignavibacteriaceae bacterium]